MSRFEVLEDHLKLLRRAVVSWDDCEFGAPAIDCKRPYGNSSVYKDIGEILSIKPELEDERFSASQQARMNQLHRETKTVLQIILASGLFCAGTFVTSSDYSTDWRLIGF